MATAPEFVIDTLNGLLDAEENNIFRVVSRASPHIVSAEPSIREPIDALRAMSLRHTRELSEMIVSHGGEPTAQVRPDERNLAFLSLKFLLPKLVAEKDLILTRYENAKARLGSDYPDVTGPLQRIEDEQRHFLDILGHAAEVVTEGKYRAPPHGKPPRRAKGR